MKKQHFVKVVHEAGWMVFVDNFLVCSHVRRAAALHCRDRLEAAILRSLDLDAARTEGFAAGRDAAARVADNHACGDCHKGPAGARLIMCETAITIAAAIRALEPPK